VIVWLQDPKQFCLEFAHNEGRLRSYRDSG